MPQSHEAENRPDKAFLQELQEKCAFLGISFSEKEFRKNPDTYIAAAKQYDNRVESFLYDRRNQMQALQRRFMQEDNMPAAMALGKARLVLTEEVHQQILAEQMSAKSRDIFNQEFGISGSDLTLKKNKERLARLADAFGTDAEALAQRLKDVPNVAQALQASLRPHELQKLALYDKDIQNTAKLMAAFSPDRPSPAEFMLKAVRETAEKAPSSAAETKTAQQKPRQTAAAAIQAFASYKDNLSRRPLLDESAKTLTKKANFEYMQKMLGDLGLHGNDANLFKMQLSRHNGTLRDFLTQYGRTQAQNAPAQAENTQAPDATARDTEAQRQAEAIEKQRLAEAFEQQRKAEALEKQRQAEALEKQRQTEEKRRQAQARKQAKAEKRAIREIEKQEIRKAAEALKKEKSARKKAEKAEQKQAQKLLKQEKKQQILQLKAAEKAKKEAIRQEKARAQAAAKREKAKAREAQKLEKVKAKDLRQQQKMQEKAARKALKAKRRQDKLALKLAEKQRRAEAKQQKKALRQARRQARKERFKQAVTSFCRQIAKPFARVDKKEQKRPQMRILTPRRQKPSLWDRLFNRKKLRQNEQRINNITLNVENYKKQKLEEKKAKILQFKQKVRETGRKTLKYAAIGAPLATMGYFGAKQLQNAGPAFDFTPITSTFRQTSLAEDIFDQATIGYSEAVSLLENSGLEYMYDVNLEPFWSEKKEPIDESDYTAEVPFIKNDKMHNVPNADFFNKCFAQSNYNYGAKEKYGISEAVYRNFMYDNRSFARLYNIGSYKNLSYDEARIIAKTEFFDKYGIGFIQNSSIASYLYYTLLKNEHDAVSVPAVADAVANYYNLSGKPITDAQMLALNNISYSGTPDPKDWHEMIAMINATASNPDDESNLYKAIQQSQFTVAIPYVNIDTEKYMAQAAVNNAYAFEPTFEPETKDDYLLFGSFADISALQDIYLPSAPEKDDATILEEQKKKDIEIFSKIYAQCSFDNVVKLSYGEKNEAFREADRSLSKHGIQGRIHRRLYCAGMSMASLCEAYDIFQRQNPNSLVGESIKNIIEKCRINAHSSTGMRDIIAKYSDRIVYSGNLEKDIKAYMDEHPYSIVQAGFRRNAAGNQHYNGFFPAFNSASTDSYTYCAYNNNHWGNENTFASVLRDQRRIRYGKKGWFVDVTAWINDETDRRIHHELAKREQLQLERENQAILEDSVQQNPPSWTIALSHKLFGRN